MTAADTDRRRLARVLRFARTSNLWRRDGNVWRDGEGTEVTWDPGEGLLSIVRTPRLLGADVELTSIGEAIGVLDALHVLPPALTPLRLSVEDLSSLQVLLSLARYDAEDDALAADLRESLPPVLFMVLPAAGGAS
jgi:hypothetical protein